MPISPEQAASLAAHMRETDGFTPAERTRLDAMTDRDIEHGALADTDAQPARSDALKRAVDARDRRRKLAARKAV